MKIVTNLLVKYRNGFGNKSVSVSLVDVEAEHGAEDSATLVARYGIVAAGIVSIIIIIIIVVDDINAMRISFVGAQVQKSPEGSAAVLTRKNKGTDVLGRNLFNEVNFCNDLVRPVVEQRRITLRRFKIMSITLVSK